MRHHILFALAVVAACAGAPARGADEAKEAKEAKEELKKLAGEWSMTGAEFMGLNAFDASQRPGLRIDADKVVLRQRGKGAS